MCYSARVNQNLEELSRRYGAEVAWEAFEELFERRMNGDDIKVARALELNFANPTSSVQRRTREYIDQYTRLRTSEWETEIFNQRKRKGEAEESLAVKETKRAREDVRIATKKILALIDRLGELRGLKAGGPGEKEERIFPMTYAPVLVEESGRILIKPMRYTCRLRGAPATNDAEYPGTYNARRDKLSGFWRNLYGRKHAVMVIRGFYENVRRHDFEGRALSPGEKPENLILQFDPRPRTEMLVACLWDHWTGANASDLDSFAATTDEPPEEIAATGHQRCVISLREQNLREWLSPNGITRDRLDSILSNVERPYYEHQIAA